ncbi:hypothetical protein D920_00158 [Enterococcus faecalis 13-SD-W-01]|nr:hypothetical protein D920_00158 [Enterococcus faecalis 13-SD-W-01]
MLQKRTRQQIYSGVSFFICVEIDNKLLTLSKSWKVFFCLMM